MKLNEQVRAYWEQEPCGTSTAIAGGLEQYSREWFERVEEHRYAVEPFIHAHAQFPRYHGKKMLEVGVGAGTDHLQWARAGADCYGVDLTDAAIETTRAHLAVYGFTSHLTRIDAERLPFEDDFFDVVYSWGVIHHSESPERIVSEIGRVLKPGGTFLGMMYNRRSVVSVRMWARHALLIGKPWRSLASVLWCHLESVGTKAYTLTELRRMFAAFSDFAAKPVTTPYDHKMVPRFISRFFPDDWGFFITIKAKK